MWSDSFAPSTNGVTRRSLANRRQVVCSYSMLFATSMPVPKAPACTEESVVDMLTSEPHGGDVSSLAKLRWRTTCMPPKPSARPRCEYNSAPAWSDFFSSIPPGVRAGALCTAKAESVVKRTYKRCPHRRGGRRHGHGRRDGGCSHRGPGSQKRQRHHANTHQTPAPASGLTMTCVSRFGIGRTSILPVSSGRNWSV